MKAPATSARWPLIVAVAMMTATWGLTQARSHADVVPVRQPFAGFPLAIGDWQGREHGLDREILDVLKLTDYMMRSYQPAGSGEAAAPVWLYVGYYASQQTGATYHSPKNCLPGAGWQIMESEETPLPLPARGPVAINRVLIQKGLDRQIVLYWYQDRGRIIASEYWAKGYLVWDALTRHRTDGALVRLTVPVVTTPEEATRRGVAFLQEVWPRLQAHLPAAEDQPTT